MLGFEAISSFPISSHAAVTVPAPSPRCLSMGAAVVAALESRGAVACRLVAVPGLSVRYRDMVVLAPALSADVTVTRPVLSGAEGSTVLSGALGASVGAALLCHGAVASRLTEECVVSVRIRGGVAVGPGLASDVTTCPGED